MADETKKFVVRLESQTDDQFRIVQGRFKDGKAAREFAAAKEQGYVDFELSDEELEAVELEHRFAEPDEIDPRTGGLYRSGTVLGPDGTARTKLHFHYLDEPYTVVDVQEL